MAGDESVMSETSFMELYQKFGDSTSMHGIGRILTNKSTSKRIVWAAMVLCVSGIAVFQFVTVVNDYYSYPVTTVVTLKYETEATFPGVTFCNINRKRKSLAGEFVEQEFTNNAEVLTRRLPRPYSACVGTNGEGSSQRNLFSNEKYSQMTCSKSCYQMSLYEHCNCCEADLPCDYHALVNKDKSIATANRIPVCNNTESLKCQFDVEDRFLKGELGCEERCPPACDQTTYDTIVSTALWPSDSYIDTLLQIANPRVFNISTSSRSSKRFARSNFLRLEIFLDSFEYLEFVAQPKYDWSMVLGNVGGLLGLWLGFSLLTGMEIAEVLMDTVVLCIRRRYTKTATGRTEQT